MLKNPSLIILDFAMPKLSGREVLDKLKKMNVNCPISVNSGYGCDSPEISVSANEISDFISKPYQLPDLLMRVRKILDKQAAVKKPNSYRS
ncbi:MAG: response regulator [Bdellovibrionota bacterium]